jgi:hypothetical protein
MSHIYDPLGRAIEMIKRNENPNSSLQMALLNLESLQQTQKFKENRFSRMEESLNFYIGHNVNMQSKLKNIQQIYDSLKKEKQTNEIYSQERIRKIRSVLWEQIEDLSKKEVDKKAHIELLQGYIFRQMQRITTLKENMSTQKRKADQDSDEPTANKRKRYLSA